MNQLKRFSPDAVIAERHRLAREIHDTLAQGFVGVMLQLEAAEAALSQNLAATASECLYRARELASDGLRQMRRSVDALRTESLEGNDLRGALSALLKKTTQGARLRTELVSSGRKRPLPSDCQHDLLHIAREALTNAIRHGKSRQFKVQLEFASHQFRMNLRDDGCGFDPTSRREGFGLQGMQERASAIGGQLAIRSAKGAGTSISVVLPLRNWSCNVPRPAASKVTVVPGDRSL